MGKYDIIVNIVKHSSLTGKETKYLLHTKPLSEINTCGLRYVPELGQDTLAIQESVVDKALGFIKPLNKKQINEMKPSEFQELLKSRTDIPEKFRTINPDSCNKKALIYTPEQLSLYDEIHNTLLLKNVDLQTQEKFLTEIMHICPENAQYAAKTLPKLINKGYDLELLAKINITENNYNHIETILKKQNILNAKIDRIIEAHIEQSIKLQKSFRSKITPEKIQEITIKEMAKRKELEQSLIRGICNEATSENIKYFDEWSKYVDSLPINGRTAGVGSIPIGLFRYWNKDSLKILKEFTPAEYTKKYELFEVISRRGHNYNSVKEIFGNQKITEGYELLLEYKKFNKFKNIDLKNFNTLSTEEKKEFINSFISVQLGKPNAIDVLKRYIKMYENIDISSKEQMYKTYSETLRKMINSIPASERKPITQKANWGIYSKNYREQNPIPALVDDLDKLPVKYETINGKKYPISEITNNTDMAISAHCTRGDSFLNVQALEFTDPQEILCVGTKGLGKSVHYNENGYSIAVKPRQGRDFWMQDYYDFDSGTGQTKNVLNVGIRFRGRNDHYAYIPELLKKELDLSQKEYTARMSKLINCTTLDEISKIDKEMEMTIRKILKENEMYEGILRPEPMGVLIPAEMPLSSINQDVLDYVELRGIKFIKVKNVTASIDAQRRKSSCDAFQNIRISS